MPSLDIHPAIRRESSINTGQSFHFVNFPGRASEMSKNGEKCLEDTCTALAYTHKRVCLRCELEKERRKCRGDVWEERSIVISCTYLFVIDARDHMFTDERFNMLNDLFVTWARDSSYGMKNIHSLRAFTSKWAAPLLSTPRNIRFTFDTTVILNATSGLHIFSADFRPNFPSKRMEDGEVGKGRHNGKVRWRESQKFAATVIMTLGLARLRQLRRRCDRDATKILRARYLSLSLSISSSNRENSKKSFALRARRPEDRRATGFLPCAHT